MMASTFYHHEMRDGREMGKALAVQPERAATSDQTWSPPVPRTAKNHPGGMSRTKSLFAISSGLSPVPDCISSIDSTSEDSEDTASGTPLPPTTLEVGFVPALRRFTGDSPHAPDFGRSELRRAMEPHLRQARLRRERSRSTRHHGCAASIASSLGVPYTSLRRERPFLFDEHTHPLHALLAEALGVSDLPQAHDAVGGGGDADGEELLLKPLRSRERRRAFHAAYDGFVTSFCIPLLHSLAISQRLLQSPDDDGDGGGDARIVYRYQAFPTIQVSRPGAAALPAPTCDSIRGHSVGCLTFHVPLTPAVGTGAMFAESHPGREDWHPLQARSVGLGYLLDGARCLHFDLANATDRTRVSLQFRVLLHRRRARDAALCPAGPGGLPLRDDRYSSPPGTYYDEAVIDAGGGGGGARGCGCVVEKAHGGLLEPDPRLGYPFA